MTNPVPIILITGFLGSGKTSFINYLIKQNPDKKISLILNEFGDIKLESEFIEAKGIGMISELSGGCLCCVANVDLPRVIRYTLEHATSTQYLIIEASGLSDPDPVRTTLTSPDLSDIVRLDTTVAIVDADNFQATAKDHPLVMSQIAEADLAIISKVDSHSAAQLDELISRVSNIGLGTRTFVWDDSFNSQIIFDPPLIKNKNITHSSHHLHAQYDEYFYTSENPHDPNKLAEVLRHLDSNILRVKGYTDYNNQHYLIQKVGNHVDLRTSNNKVSQLQTIILIIGANLDKLTLNTLFTSCKS